MSVYSLEYYYRNRGRMLAQQRSYYAANRVRILRRQLQGRKRYMMWRGPLSARRIPPPPRDLKRVTPPPREQPTPREPERIVVPLDDLTELVDVDDPWFEFAV